MATGPWQLHLKKNQTITIVIATFQRALPWPSWPRGTPSPSLFSISQDRFRSALVTNNSKSILALNKSYLFIYLFTHKKFPEKVLAIFQWSHLLCGNPASHSPSVYLMIPPGVLSWLPSTSEGERAWEWHITNPKLQPGSHITFLPTSYQPEFIKWPCLTSAG